MRFKLILAVSRDGFLARGPDDDMRWTGRGDKLLFRLLTSVAHGRPHPLTPVLLAGRRTARLMPKLEGRCVVTLSRDPLEGYDLRDAARRWPDAWLVGGPTVAEQALDLGLVESAYLVGNPEALGSGISAEPIQSRLRPHIAFRGGLGYVDVEVYQAINAGRFWGMDGGT